MIEGFFAALWCAGLLYAGDVFGGGVHPIDRLRNAIVIGVALPGVLGLVHLLYPIALWAALIALCAVRFARRRDARLKIDAGLAATLGATFVVLWPPLARPILNGDSLEYHVPNAMTWIQAHSLWTTQAPYWYYPGGSELFAAGLLGAAGRWTLPLAGAAAAMLLAGRLYTCARLRAAPAYAAAALALAFVCMPLAAFQDGLQNDLWLAAFFVEAMVAANAGTLGMLALIKPFGVFEAAIATLATRPHWKTIGIAAIPFIVWLMRDLALLHGATVASDPPYWASTIAGNFPSSFAPLANVFVHVSPHAALWSAALLAGLAFPTTRRYALAGIAAFILWLILPLSWGSPTTNYLVNGSSLRFALPAFACGALVTSYALHRAPRAATLGLGLVAVVGAFTVLGIYWNDSITRDAPLVAMLCMLPALIRPNLRLATGAAILTLVVTAATHFAQSRALSFYNAWMVGPHGEQTQVFSWLASTRPPRIVAQFVRTGAIFFASPSTSATEVSAAFDGCAAARKAGALYMVGTNELQTPSDAAGPFARARACGAVRYADSAAIVVYPQPSASPTSARNGSSASFQASTNVRKMWPVNPQIRRSP